MKKFRWLQLAIGLFIVINIILVAIDNGGKVDRVAYVNDWSESTVTDMQDELMKPAVLVPEWEQPVYFDESQGVFNEFLVEAGDIVTLGQDLFTYQVENYYETEAQILSEIERVNGQITATEQAIVEIELYQFIEEPSMPQVLEDNTISIEMPTNSLEAEFMKEQFLAAKNQELAEKNAEKTALESQLGSLRESGDTVTYPAPRFGKVNNISTELDSPILVLESLDVEAYGDVTEEERAQIETGMKAELKMNEVDATRAGTVDTVAHSPDRLSVTGNSIYPFTIALGKEEESLLVGESDEFETEEEAPILLPGYHGTLAITLEERLNVTAIEETALIDEAVWKMGTDGMLTKQAVEIGLSQDGQLEVLDNVAPDDTLAEAPKRELRDQAYYITPLQWSKLKSRSFNMKEADWQKGFVSGLISR